jgi:hypothetical protein
MRMDFISEQKNKKVDKALDFLINIIFHILFLYNNILMNNLQLKHIFLRFI